MLPVIWFSLSWDIICHKFGLSLLLSVSVVVSLLPIGCCCLPSRVIFCCLSVLLSVFCHCLVLLFVAVCLLLSVGVCLLLLYWCLSSSISCCMFLSMSMCLVTYSCQLPAVSCLVLVAWCKKKISWPYQGLQATQRVPFPVYKGEKPKLNVSWREKWMLVRLLLSLAIYTQKETIPKI